MALHIHRAERSDRLADALAAMLRQPSADPFTPEIVCVPSRGVERWLAQRLSHRLGAGTDGDGVCANVLFPSVAELVAERADEWRPDRLVWRLLEVIDECVAAAEPWCRTLTWYLTGDDVRRGRRWATARKLAGLFDSYGLHRPHMLRAWSAGADVDGVGRDLPADLHWQPELWRRLGKRTTVPSPAERLPELCERLSQDTSRPRTSVFGLTRLPAAHAAILAAMATWQDVHLWLPHPSPALWEALRPLAGDPGPVPRAEDPTRAVPRHPVLRSLGRDVRELQLTLAAAGAGPQHHDHGGTPYPETRLGRLQRAIATDRPSPPDADDDGSVQVHACHGPDRQVEVLREVLLGLLEADPALEPRDIVVMCPDIEAYAPLISASFGLGADAAHPAHRLRVRLADRALRRVNPLFEVVARLLDLADARVTAAQVLDLAALPPVRLRFGLADDDLDRLRELVTGAGVRWGLDAAHRARWDVGARSNTWAAGLDRILLGVAMSEDEPHWLGTALPYDDLDSHDADLAGRLAELIDRLAAALASLTGEHPAERWLTTLDRAIDALTATGERDAWQETQFRAELAEIGGDGGVLSLTDVRALLDERLGGRPTRANFRTGDLTVCTMVPMRSVPHRVVCVLGLDDGVFPRGTGADGDDVLSRTACVGERDPRGEDRQLLLDAVMAATGHLILLYSGADERTNAPRPPAVPLDELLDALGRTEIRHPLQPHDARNFTPGELGRAGPFSFDRVALAGAAAAVGDRPADPPFLAAPLPPLEPEPVRLDELHAFFAHPVRAFLRRRLGAGVTGTDEEPADGLPIELDGLQQWAVGERLLRSLLAGVDLDRAVQAEWRRGTVPPGPLGTRLLDRLAAEIRPLADAARPHLTGEPRAVDLTVRLPDGRQLSGTVGGVHGDTVAAVSYSRLSPKHRLRAWIDLLALTAADPDRPWRTVTIGRGRPARSQFAPIDAATAAGCLADLVALADEGLCEPVPLTAKASAAYAECRLSGGTPDAATAKATAQWARYPTGGEQEDPAHLVVFGQSAPLDHPRFAELAMRVWEPLSRAEWTGPL